MIGRDRIHEGMTVRSFDGEKLGKITELGERGFLIEKGLFFVKDYQARYDDVVDFRDDEIILSIGKDQLREAGEATTAGTGHRPGVARAEAGDVSVPVAEEQLEISKRDEVTGEIRVRKDVTQETRTVEVPVTKERVEIERVAVPSEPAKEGASFKESEIVVPVHEEKVEVRKTPVVTEEVRVHKDVTAEPQRVTETVRKEKVDIDKESKKGKRRRPDVERR